LQGLVNISYSEEMAVAETANYSSVMIASCLLLTFVISPAEHPAFAQAADAPATPDAAQDPRDLEAQRRLALAHRRRTELRRTEMTQEATIGRQDAASPGAPEKRRARPATARTGRAPARHRADSDATAADTNP
jgi:hypothetical protein